MRDQNFSSWLLPAAVLVVLLFSNNALGKILGTVVELERTHWGAITTPVSDDNGNGRLVVFTALFGHIDDLRKQPQEDGIDYLCFTDRTEYVNDENGFVRGWKIVYVERLPNLDGRRMNRHIKLLPHLYLDRNVTRSLYIDGTVDLKMQPSKVFDYFLPSEQDYNFGHGLHPEGRLNWKDEIRVTIERGRGDKDLLAAQEKAYQNRNISLSAWKGLWANFALARRHSPAMQEFSKLWWNELLQYSERDQVGLAGALHEDSVVQKKYRISQRRVPCGPTGNKAIRKRLHSWYKEPAADRPRHGNQVPYVIEE
eukprot:gb/GECG01004161.1/.p1 GENE.gb/GECG01004161.1/~~gb/GECG01004161.1/.p1  ORF type:complete len:311 (+),score=24.53 gb/GECG01004161.1/:1-933(+)